MPTKTCGMPVELAIDLITSNWSSSLRPGTHFRQMLGLIDQHRRRSAVPERLFDCVLIFGARRPRIGVKRESRPAQVPTAFPYGPVCNRSAAPAWRRGVAGNAPSS